MSNADALFCNTHIRSLSLFGIIQVVSEAGGLHAFMNRDRNKPLITDSGGFQVFSMAAGGDSSHEKSAGDLKRSQLLKNPKAKEGGPTLLKVTEEGALFRSYRDGKHILLTPESSVQAQKMLGADIIIPLDELLPHDVPRSRLEASVALTHRWEARSLQEHLKRVTADAGHGQAMYGVIHGGGAETLDLRQGENCYA
jgi:queuine tRNA-ribosyltransferase